MTSSLNPYQPPQEHGAPVEPPSDFDAEGPWRSGTVLVTRKGASLPPRCVKTNLPAERTLWCKVSWHPPAFAWTMLAGPVYVVVALIVRKRARIDVGLTGERYRRFRLLHSAVWLFGGLSLAPIWFGGTMLLDGSRGYPLVIAVVMAVGGSVMLLASLVYGRYSAPVVGVQKIDDRFVWLTGVCEAYLAELPPWPYS
ncbi:MAG: hypothetical protein RIC55_11010 [Pirellulaceae bacterium]